MDRSVLMMLVLVFLVLLLTLMAVGWRMRQRRQASLGRPMVEPDEVGREVFVAEGFYVSTSLASDPLNRVAVHGLGYRSRVTVRVTEAGVALRLRGQPGIFIPTTDLLGVERATWTIDRVVEPGGLVAIRWQLNAPDSHTDVDSYLRFTDPGDAAEFLTVLSTTHLHRTIEGDHTT